MSRKQRTGRAAVLFAIAVLAVAATAAASEPVVIVERTTQAENAKWIHRTTEQPETGIGEPAAAPPSDLSVAVGRGATEPSSGDWLAPFFVDPSNPAGTTTLISVTNDGNAPTPAVLVGFFSALGTQFHSEVISLAAGELRSFNVRDQPNLLTQESGLIGVLGSSDAKLSVDYYVVTPDEDFATGGLGFTVADRCRTWRARVLVGGPFTGGTDLVFVSTDPQGIGPADPPTVVGSLFDEAGALVDSFQIKTNSIVFRIDVTSLTSQPTVFGYAELAFNPPTGDGGHVVTSVSAEGRYSVSTPAICLDSVPTP